MYKELFQEAGKYYKEDVCGKRKGLLNPVLMLTKRVELDSFIHNLEKESTGLWRYDKSAVPFNHDRWEETCINHWIYKRSFPTLFGEDCLYDKREVVIAAVMAGRLSVGESDELLDALSIGKQSYDTRRLYPLHFKEGFFRMLIAWDEQHGYTVSFDDGAGLYEKYESRILQDTLSLFAQLKGQYENTDINRLTDKSYEMLAKSFGRCRKLAEEMGRITCPLTLLQQDELQRLLVLTAHLERNLLEASAGNLSEDANGSEAKKNAGTRSRKERGTILCKKVTEKAASCEKIEDAVETFLKEGVPEMGEACWRAISYIVSSYASDCAKAYKESYLHKEKKYSYRGNASKKTPGYRLFEDNRPLEENILSFSLDEEDVRARVSSASELAAVIEDLFIPEARLYNDIAAQTDQDRTRRELGTFLGEYKKWCDGERETGKGEGRRRYLPFHEWKRERMIRYALATGGKEPAYIHAFLEASGNGDLNPSNPPEALLIRSLDFCREHKDISKRPVEAIWLMQVCLGLVMAKEAAGRISKVDLKSYMQSCAERYDGCLLYEMKPKGMTGKDGILLLKMQLCLMTVLVLCEKQACAESGSEDDSWLNAVFMALEGIYDPKSRDEKEGAASDSRVESVWDFDVNDAEAMRIGFEELRKSIASESCEEDIRDEIIDDEINDDEVFDYAYAAAIQELLAIVLNTGKSLSFGKYGNVIALRQLYDLWSRVLESAGEYASIHDMAEMDGIRKKHELFLQMYSLYWIYYGGCKNFSLTHYEQLYGINHFSDRKEDVKIHQDGSRWKKDGALEDAMPMWAEILDNSRMLCMMHSMADLPEEMDPFVKFDIPKHLKEMEAELKTIREIAKEGDYPKQLNIVGVYEEYDRTFTENVLQLALGNSITDKNCH